MGQVFVELRHVIIRINECVIDMVHVFTPHNCQLIVMHSPIINARLGLDYNNYM